MFIRWLSLYCHATECVHMYAIHMHLHIHTEVGAIALKPLHFNEMLLIYTVTFDFKLYLMPRVLLGYFPLFPCDIYMICKRLCIMCWPLMKFWNWTICRSQASHTNWKYVTMLFDDWTEPIEHTTPIQLIIFGQPKVWCKIMLKML